MYENGVEDIDLGLINEEGFEEDGRDGRAFAKDEEDCIEPRTGTVEDAQKSDLWKIGPDEERDEYKRGEQDSTLR